MRKPILYGLLLFVMVVWGFNVIAVKIIVENFAPVTITSFRILLAGTVVLLILIFQKEMKKINKVEAMYVAIGAFTGVLGHHIFLALGLTTTTASNASLILGLIPLMTSIFAVWFLKSTFTIGNFFVFMSVIAQAISFVAIKKASQTLDTKVMTGYMLILGSLFLFITSLLMEPSGLNSLPEGPFYVWIIFIVSAVVATGLGHIIYNNAIHHLGAGETAIFINLTPFFALTGSVLFLGEKITYFQLMGFVFIISGVLLGSGLFDNKISQRREPVVKSY
ncbi:DMT family transporter [Cytobacillus sp. S13-E01]|uniref:DMT family transporter n=1 Tax=Cytobacillus sp. S13-E01 TaxID=3031326 RepID=UPI0023D84702|nr:DMT family transporter [Cytobacillus sp. S13-E01]MDF0725461.1 DMT family transporter [Cytobacillus sp. S13-E01]